MTTGSSSKPDLQLIYGVCMPHAPPACDGGLQTCVIHLKLLLTVHAAAGVCCRYFYYTAGSGGVGTTILETSFLLAGTDVEVYVDNKKVRDRLRHG